MCVSNSWFPCCCYCDLAAAVGVTAADADTTVRAGVDTAAVAADTAATVADIFCHTDFSPGLWGVGRVLREIVAVVAPSVAAVAIVEAAASGVSAAAGVAAAVGARQNHHGRAT